MPDENLRFEFGKNWRSFVHNALDENRVQIAAESMRRILRVDTLQGKTFLDIGCGSGIFSLVACILQADRVVSFDYDSHSVQASLGIRSRANISPQKWEILTGSVLNQDFLNTLGVFDIVYSWGVLHHTGSMWQAIDNAVSKVKPGGMLAISIYNNLERMGGSAMWWHIKRMYNYSPGWVQTPTVYIYGCYKMLRHIVTLRNPLKLIRGYAENTGRGMDFWHDLRDWMGGFPYEFATAGEIFNYLHEKFDLQLAYLNTHDGVHTCNEYMFQKPE